MNQNIIASALDGLLVEKIAIAIRPTREVTLPYYLGSTLRGGLAWGLKKVTCALKNQSCEGCLLWERCAYSQIFETPLPQNAAALVGQDNPSHPLLQNKLPHPLVIEPPPEREAPWTKGEELVFHLVLVGNALEFFPFLVAAVDEMCKAGLGADRYPFELSSISTGSGKNHQIWTPGSSRSLPFLEGRPITNWLHESPPQKRVTIEFTTPVHIVSGKAMERQVSCRGYFRSLLTRLSSFLAFQAGAYPNWDYRHFLSEADKVVVRRSDFRKKIIKRWSNRQKSHLDLVGVVGSVEWEGDVISELWAIVVAGSLLHVGKASVFGLGKYRICPGKNR